MICCAILLFSCRWLVKYFLFEKRGTKDWQQLYHAFDVAEFIDFDAFKEVLIQAGKSYELTPTKFLPSDSFLGNLGKIDSWNLGAGAESLETYLVNQFNFKSFQDSEKQTLRDLFINLKSKG